MTVFIRVLDAAVEDKPAALLRGVIQTRQASTLDAATTIFMRAPETFVSVPGSPFAYWVSETVRGTFSRHPRLEQHYTATRGAYTTDDFKYYRLAWEVPAASRAKTREETLGTLAYVPLAKGGAFSPYYADIHLVVRWHDDGAEAKAFLSAYRERKGWGTDWSACLNGYSQYFRRGLTWPRRTNGLSFRVLPAGSIFGDKGPAAFVEGDSPELLLALSALANSRAFGYLVSVQLARTELAQSYEVGLIQQTPVPTLSDTDVTTLSRLARRAWSLKRSLDTTHETSHAFVLPTGLNEKLTSLDLIAAERELGLIQQQIDDTAFSLYGIGPDDQVTIEASSKRAALVGSSQDTDKGDDEADDGSDEDAPFEPGTESLNSWLVGGVFGRFDLRLATRVRAIPPEPEPFDPLPSRSPGMYPEGDEPADRPDMLVDDEGHADDLAARVRAVADRVRVEVPENLRGWLAKEFFPLHIKMYSKSRRKAPVYWQLATPSASYSVWLYLHAFSTDTFFRVQNDYAAPKLAHEERRLESMTRELAAKATAAQRKELSAQESFVDELRAFLEEVKRVAPLWNPDLDDGAAINFAPLWRLVPQHKPWQKELKATWDALCEGKYDWAHLATHLWPERVVPKCAKDRSLAIAHGLEDVFWVEGADGKWTARKTPTRSIDDLVRERTSPAVKAALKSLLEAPVAQGGAGRGRGGRSRAAASADEGGSR
jgi:hypothetical protein